MEMCDSSGVVCCDRIGETFNDKGVKLHGRTLPPPSFGGVYRVSCLGLLGGVKS
jgi:hypothetical protein